MLWLPIAFTVADTDPVPLAVTSLVSAVIPDPPEAAAHVVTPPTVVKTKVFVPAGAMFVTGKRPVTYPAPPARFSAEYVRALAPVT
jgi:hypothetical protein